MLLVKARMPYGTRAFFYTYSLGTDLNEWPLIGSHWGQT